MLVYPKTGWDIKNVSALLPLSVLYLIQPLKTAGFDVSVVDQRIDPHWDKTLLAHLAHSETFAVGISAMTGLQIKWGLAAAKIAKTFRKDIYCIWGGIHPSLMPEQTLENDLVGVVVKGEGEVTFPKLLTALKNTTPLEDVKGIAFRAGQEVFQSPRRDFIDLNASGFPPYDDLNSSDYITTQTLGLSDIAITTSRGCPNRCAYCYNVPYSNRKWRAQSADSVLEHIRYILRKFDVQGILIKDDNFFVDKERVLAIANGLLKLPRPVIVRAECRADYIAREWDQDFLNYLGDCGIREMTVGAESGSDETLSVLCKDITVDDILRANRRLCKAKIATKFTFMTGYPHETEKHVRQTLDLMLALLSESEYARLTPLHLFAPYPGTKLFNQSVKLGFTPPASLEKWADVDFHHARHPWISKSMSKKLEKASIATYFMDGKTVPEYFSTYSLIRLFAKIYSRIVRFRAAHFCFSMMPEVSFIEWIRRKRTENVKIPKISPRKIKRKKKKINPGGSTGL